MTACGNSDSQSTEKTQSSQATEKATDAGAEADRGYFIWDEEKEGVIRGYSEEGLKQTEIVIPDSVTEIGSHAFQRCNSLTVVRLPDTLEEIGMKVYLTEGSPLDKAFDELEGVEYLEKVFQ